MKIPQTRIKTAEFLSKIFKNLGDFLVFLCQRAKDDTILRVSSSLSYTSLIALMPLLAVALAVFSAFPIFADVREQLQALILKNFVPEIETEINTYLNEFINIIPKLTTVGVVGITITSILLLSTIENSFNFIFKVHKPRRIATKITLYWTVITLGPLLMGAALSLRGYLYSLQNLISPSLQISLAYALPGLINFTILVMIYVLVPNRKVHISHAIIGAMTAFFLFWFMRQFFSLMILKSSTYQTLYGAFTAIPVLLVWMYLVWAVVIFGAVVTAGLDDFLKLRASLLTETKSEQKKKNNSKN